VIPAVVLTGFLGAGKTTALNALLAARPGLRIGVVENEAGEVSVDTDLLEGAARVVDVVGGCACCTVRGALGAALELLAARAHELDAVVIEASGIADPVPIVQSLQVPSARSTMALSAIVCVVDAAAMAAWERPPHVWTRQVRFADHVMLAKSEHVPEHAHAVLRRRVLEHSPQATIVASLLEVDSLLAVPAAARPAPEPEPDGRDGPGHGFSAHALRVERPLDAVALDRWVSALLRDPGVVRVKGTVAVAGLEHRYVINGTPQHLQTYPDPGSSSPGVARSRLVVIGSGLEREALQAGLGRCAAAAQP